MAIKNLFRRAADSRQGAQTFISEKLGDTTINSSPLVHEKDPEFGASPIIKTFYEGKGSSQGHYDWVETPPKQLKEKTARAYDRVAVKLYKVKDLSQNTIAGRTPLKIHSIDIQSPLLVAALKPILEESGVFLDENDTAKFEEPFKPLYFGFDKISALRDQVMKDVVFASYLGLLLRLMADLFEDMRVKLHSLRQSQLINFDLAWTYFPKGLVLYCGAGDCERLFRVRSTGYNSDRNGRQLEIFCEYIVFNGISFEWETTTLKIPAFGGNVPITDLPHYPLEFHGSVASLKARMATRGTKVLDYQGLEYRQYTGTGLGGLNKKYNVGGHILL